MASPPPQDQQQRSESPPSTAIPAILPHRPEASAPTASTDQDHPDLSISSPSVPWFYPSTPKIPTTMSNLLTTYAGVDPSEQLSHILAIRSKAWAVHPYPCIGLYAFLRLHLQDSPMWESILSELRDESGSLFVDLGAGLGQEVRSLLAAGAPTSRVRGVELEARFNEFGFEMFRDGERIGGRARVMREGDILCDDPQSKTWLGELFGEVSILHAASFLHLLDYQGQVEVGCRMVRLMQDRVGVRMLGRQIGSVVAKEKVHPTNKNGRKMFKHDVESFGRMWESIGRMTGTKWKVSAEMGKPYVVMDERTGQWWHDPDTRTIIWSLVRVDE